MADRNTNLVFLSCAASAILRASASGSLISTGGNGGGVADKCGSSTRCTVAVTRLRRGGSPGTPEGSSLIILLLVVLLILKFGNGGTGAGRDTEPSARGPMIAVSVTTAGVVSGSVSSAVGTVTAGTVTAGTVTADSVTAGAVVDAGSVAEGACAASKLWIMKPKQRIREIIG